MKIQVRGSCGHMFAENKGFQGPVSISENTSYRKISWSIEAARFVFRIVRLLPMCLSNFKAIRQFEVPISWLRDFTRSYNKTSFWILRRGPGSWHYGSVPAATISKLWSNVYEMLTLVRKISLSSNKVSHKTKIFITSVKIQLWWITIKTTSAMFTWECG